MTLAGVKKELRDLKKGYAPGFKTIEELLNIPEEGLHKLTDQELFRLLQYYEPNLTSLEDLTNEVLEQMVKGEYP